jgi:hypothetical protein
MGNEKDDIMDDIIGIYSKIGAPLTWFTIFVGLGSSVIGELEAKPPNSALVSFVNITGTTFIGFMSGLLWPVTMPILGMGAVFNKTFRRKN